MVVHPIFDIEKQVWATDEGLEAKSLAELQTMLPGVSIEGYHPNGYYVDHGKLLLNGMSEAAPRGFFRSELRTCHNGHNKSTTRKIAAALRARKGIEPEVRVSSIQLAKKKPHNLPVRGNTGQINWEAAKSILEALVSKGKSASTIAAELHVSRNQVMGACTRLGLRLGRVGSQSSSMPQVELHERVTSS